MASLEYQIHEKVNELLKLLNIPDAMEKAPAISDYFYANRSMFDSPMHQAKLKLAESAPNRLDFVKKYDELKEKNLQNLDQLVFFLAEIHDRHKIRNMLERRSPLTSANINVTSTLSSGKYSSFELNKMKEQLLKRNNQVLVIPSSVISKIGLNTTGANQQTSLTAVKKEIANCPEYPSWVNERPYLTWDFYPNSEKFETDSEVTKLPISAQEDMIIEDLLNCMSGIEGKFIKTPSLIDKHSDRTFYVDRSLDPAMRELAKRIVPICSNYSLIIRFIEEKSQFKWGLVNHALCASIRELLKNHYVLICQLENLHNNGNLSLQKLWYYVNPVMGFMEIINSIVKVINKGDCCGSSVINLLFEKVLAYSGDPKLQELIFYLAQTASKPYLTMLEEWIYKGQICDPYSEFMIVEDKDISKEKLKEDFNEKNNTPKFLESLSEKILLTGKYLNAIHETGKSELKPIKSPSDLKELKDYTSYNEQQQSDDDDVIDRVAVVGGISLKKLAGEQLMVPNAREIIFTTKEEVYKQLVEKAYSFSSKVLLNLLLKDYKLIDRLRSLKHYFLLDQSDFMVHFMDISEEEMKKNVREIKSSRLESLLELSLRITSANSDPYKDDLRVKLFSIDLKSMIMKIQNIEQTMMEHKADAQSAEINLTGLSSFSLDYVVKWPLSLIINRKTLFKYQILFRHVFLMKHVERQLCNVWLCTRSGELCLGRSYKYYSLACALKQRMLNFIQNLLNYMTFEVFESSWISFEEKIRNVTNIDDLIAQHNFFLDTCLRECLITSRSFLNIQKIMSICSMFSEFVQAITLSSKEKEESAKLDPKLNFKQAQEKRKLTLQEISDDLNKLVNSDIFAKTISDYDKQFSLVLLDFLERIINEMSNSLGETKIGNVLYRLDFNDYYREKIEQLRQLKIQTADLEVSHRS